jgi:hypothetical protein
LTASILLRMSDMQRLYDLRKARILALELKCALFVSKSTS